jgi:hypothetical protein
VSIQKHMRCRMPLARAAAVWAQHHGIHRPPRATLQRWIRQGLRGVHLKAELFGGRLYTTPGDLEAFHAAMNATAPAAEGDES